MNGYVDEYVDETQGFKLIRFIVAAFFVATVASSLLDVSLGSKLMPNNSVHMAETSDKTFDDVVGIDEVRNPPPPEKKTKK